jgi:septum formation protein
MNPPIILASASPRRVQLLQEAGLVFEVVVPNVDEAHDISLSCEELTVANALLKAQAITQTRPEAAVIGADTLVYIEGHPLAKPADLHEGRAMLRRLSGRTHQVCTGVAIVSPGQIQTFAVITNVSFKALTDDLITAYHAKVNVLDKAGGYAVQEHGDLIVEQVSGSLSNVVGLPVDEVLAALHQLSA